MTARSKAPEPAQLELVELNFGCFIFPTSVFSSEAEARASWRKYRAQLLEAAAPGQRPRAFYRFEIAVAPPQRWFDEINLLLDRALIAAEEAAVLDLQPGVLSKDQSARFCSAFETCEGVRSQGLGTAGLRYLLGEFSTAARYHGWRDRSELSEKYRRLAQVVAQVIEEREL